MENLNFEKTKNTFGIVTDISQGKILIEGASYPENAVDFFDPLFAWFENFRKVKNSELYVEFRITYLNTSSSKCVIDFMDQLEEYHQSGKQVSMKWYYEESDEDIMETGLEMTEDLSFNCEIISY